MQNIILEEIFDQFEIKTSRGVHSSMFQRLILCGLGEKNWGVFGVMLSGGSYLL